MSDATQIRLERRLNIIVTVISIVALLGGPLITFVVFKALTEQRLTQIDSLNQLQEDRLKLLESEKVETTRSLTRIETKLDILMDEKKRGGG